MGDGMNVLLEDMERLKRASLPETRCDIADKISKCLEFGEFEGVEVGVAAEIIRLLAKDAEIRVRQTLANNLKHSSSLPHDVALEMAQDVEEVSLPVLEFSNILTEQDLVDIIQSTAEIKKMVAIAKRDAVQEPVSDALVRKGNDEVVTHLVANAGALIHENSYAMILEEFRENGGVITTLVNRGDLPLGIAEKMVFMVSGEMQEKLKQNYEISDAILSQLTSESREEVTLGLLDDSVNVPVDGESAANSRIAYKHEMDVSVKREKKLSQVIQLVTHLYKQDRLTHSIILRALCEGNISFFEVGIARLAGVPNQNVSRLLEKESEEAFTSLCIKAKIPETMAKPMHVIYHFVRKETENDLVTDKASFSQKLIQYIIENDFDTSVPFMPYIMALVGSNLRTSDIIN